jgi:histidinol-phosphate aminotransferase
MKEHLRALERVRGGTYRDTRVGLFLDRNERIVPYDSEVVEALSERLSKISLSLYPELVPFYQKLSDWLNLSTNQIYVTEGVSGAIKSLMETITSPGDNVVCPTPTFALYPVYSQMFQLEHRTVGYTDDYQLDLERLLELIDDRTSIVFLPNPNMPISGTVPLKQIASIAGHCEKHNAVLAVDEVYYPFGGPTAIGLIGEHKNLFVMRSFSKAFGLAGIRVGYLLGNDEQIDYVSKTRTGYEINSVSMGICSFFIERFHLVEEYIQQVKDGLSYLKSKLDDIELEYNGGNYGNFLYVELKDEELAQNIVYALRERKIYIRGRWPFPYSTGISITGAPVNIMREFYKEFYDVYQSKSTQ